MIGSYVFPIKAELGKIAAHPAEGGLCFFTFLSLRFVQSPGIGGIFSDFSLDKAGRKLYQENQEPN